MLKRLAVKALTYVIMKSKPVKELISKIGSFLVMHVIAKIKWKQRDELNSTEKAKIADLLTRDYYIIATRRKNYLSAFFISLGHWLLTFKWGHYTHVLMNLEDEVNDVSDFRLIEATTTGTKYSEFDVVFDGVDSVALLKPKRLSLSEWTRVMDSATVHLGKPYDSLFDLKDATKVSCVELIRLAMQALPNYQTLFPDFERTIAKKKNLTPQMFLDCPDFEVVFEITK
jgi:hypothetical protein